MFTYNYTTTCIFNNSVLQSEINFLCVKYENCSEGILLQMYRGYHLDSVTWPRQNQWMPHWNHLH